MLSKKESNLASTLTKFKEKQKKRILKVYVVVIRTTKKVHDI